jgi:hypothetical protein
VSNIDPVKKSSAATDNFVIGPITAVGAALAGMGAAMSPTADAATFTVTNLNDSGAGSLRQAIEDGNGAAGADNVTFQAGLSGTILLTSGQLEITDALTITGPGPAALSVSGNNASRVFYLYNNASNIAVEISGLTITGGNASIGAGLVNFDEDLVLDNVVVSGNTATGDGGGLWLDGPNMDVTIRNSTISGNNAADEGGGIYSEDNGGPLLITDSRITGNTAANGGGVYFYDPDNDITIQRTTISGNTATGGGNRAQGVPASGLGGGIYFYSADAGAQLLADSTVSGNQAGDGGGIYFYYADQPMLISNSTISGNSAADNGGGIAFYYGGDSSVEIESSTIAENSAGQYAAGIHMYNGSLALRNTIVANNTGDDDLSGGNFDVAFSLVENGDANDITDGGGNIFGIDPLLGPLANNGGATQTHLPLLGSPVIDAGDPAFVPPPSVDQAGNPRVTGSAIDMGAIEAVAQLVPEVPVPTLGILGLAAAALGIGGIGAVAARRRKGASGPLAAVLFAAAGMAGLHAPTVSAAGPATTRVVTTVNTVTTDASRTSFALGNGQSVVAESATLVIKDSRRGDVPVVRSASAIAAGQPVLIKVRYGRDGAVKRTVVRLFDTLAKAEREVAGK